MYSLLILLFILILITGCLYYKNLNLLNRRVASPPYNSGDDLFIQKPNAEKLPPISDSQLLRGWYWGTEKQKLPGTPSTWIYTEAGRSSCWHSKSVPCTPSSSYTCPQSGYIDCMPTVGVEKRNYKCTKEAISWYTENCPNFQGVAY